MCFLQISVHRDVNSNGMDTRYCRIILMKSASPSETLMMSIVMYGGM